MKTGNFIVNIVFIQTLPESHFTKKVTRFETGSLWKALWKNYERNIFPSSIDLTYTIGLHCFWSLKLIHQEIMSHKRFFFLLNSIQS